MSWANKRTLAIGGVAVGVVALIFPRTTSQVAPNAFETPAVKNIANRYSAGGATKTHTPGAATNRGDANKTEANVETLKGVGSPQFEDSHAAQKPGQPSRVSAAFHQAQYGNSNSKGK